MRGGFIGCRHIPGMAKLAEIAEGVRDVPIAFGVDRIFTLHFVAVLARRGLRSALRQAPAHFHGTIQVLGFNLRRGIDGRDDRQGARAELAGRRRGDRA